MKTKILLLTLIGGAAAMLLSGCTSITSHGYILTQTTTVLGIQVAASDPSTQTPKVQVGLVRDIIEFVPTATTNGVITAAPHATSINIANKALPFGLDVHEVTASGDYSSTAIAGTNSDTTLPIVPTPH